MKLKKRQRFYFILFVLACLGAALGLSLYALQDTVSYFHSPSEVKAFQAEQSPRVAAGHRFRLGGLVKEGSIRKNGPAVSFTVTDNAEEMQVMYTGILPDLFREGQGVIATGSIDGKNVFQANELLAKHDEKYMPPEVAKALERTKIQ